MTRPIRPTDIAVRYGLFALLTLALHFTIAYLLTPSVFEGGLTEPDGYMRLVRVQRLWETGAWLDGSIPRSNAPFGETLHWTRPFDVWLLAGAAPLSLLIPFRDALHAWAVVSTPLLLVATCIAASWAVKPLLSTPARLMVMVALLVQPAVMSYALPGRADHHVLIFLAFVVFLGALFRSVGPERAVVWDRATGLALAFATWLTVESLVAWVALLLALAVLWVLRGGDVPGRARTVLTAVAAGIVVAITLERGPAGLTLIEFDRISPVHVLVAVTGVVAWWAIGTASARSSWGGTAGRRTALVLGAGAAAALVLRVAVPDFFRGPWADLTLEEQAYWVGVINELQPVVPTPARLGVFVAYLGPALVCVPFALWRLRKERDRAVHACWVVVVTLLALYVPLGMSSLRFTPFPQILFAVTIAALLATAGSSLAARTAPTAAVALRIALATSLLGGFLVLGGLLSPQPPETTGEAVAPCLVPALADDLPSSESRVILAHQDFGQEILYFTRHHVLGTVYHRNIDAVRLTHSILRGSDVVESRRLLESRGVDLILLCPSQKGGFFGRESPDGGETFYAKLVEGREPGWLRRRPVEQDGAQGFLLFAVEP